MSEENPSGTETQESQEQSENSQVESLRTESASYRTQRNDALRKAHAFETMLKAHNIPLDVVKDETIKTLPIKEGKVDGAFQYKAAVPNVSKKTPSQMAPKGAGSATLTREQVEQMSPQQINKNWDQVQIFLKSQ